MYKSGFKFYCKDSVFFYFRSKIKCKFFLEKLGKENALVFTAANLGWNIIAGFKLNVILEFFRLLIWMERKEMVCQLYYNSN